MTSEPRMRQTCVWLKRTPCMRSMTAPTRLQLMKRREPDGRFDHRMVVGAFRHSRHCRTTDRPIAKIYLVGWTRPTSAVL
jgi:hypothetical protein